MTDITQTPAPASTPTPTPSSTADPITPNITSKAIQDILLERSSQIQIKGYSLEIDDSGAPGRLAAAGACYAIHSAYTTNLGIGLLGTPEWWPFASDQWKPKTNRENLVKAGALIIAEIERLDRLAKSTTESIRNPEQYL